MSNVLVEQDDVLSETLKLRHSMLDMLTDADLAHRFPNNKSLGELCRELAEHEHIYIESFKTFTMNWGYSAPNAAELESKVDILRRIYSEQEKDFRETVTALSNETIHNQTVDRGGFQPTVEVQFHIYREALLIFYAKASIYLRALQKDLPDQWKYWIG
jgi:hypothetical protein